jgi:2-keto-4-pentenoate hydratase
LCRNTPAEVLKKNLKAKLYEDDEVTPKAIHIEEAEAIQAIEVSIRAAEGGLDEFKMNPCSPWYDEEYANSPEVAAMKASMSDEHKEVI